MDEEVGVYLTGDHEQRTEGMPTGRKFARFECVYTSRFMGDFPVCLAKTGGYKANRKGSKKATMEIRKVRKVGK